jgi:hypothetical protein
MVGLGEVALACQLFIHLFVLGELEAVVIDYNVPQKLDR